MSLLVGPTMCQTLSFNRDLGIELGQRPVPVLDDVVLVIKLSKALGEGLQPGRAGRLHPLDQLQEHDTGAAVWRRPGEQTLTAELSNPDGAVLYCRQAARAEAEEERRQAAEREARRPVCRRCGLKFTDQRWEKLTMHGAEG
ncbi:hypothetical protein ACFWJ5_23185 [Streptomyces qaidamensis]|uniref:hypothetical protein n=1 Tax=Streptomyces qaidamensis TaxID=1783515 RepID=UPI00365543C5